MKELSQTCHDCPSREIFPELAKLMEIIDKEYPEMGKLARSEQKSPMFAAVVALRTETQKLAQAEEDIEALNARIKELEARLTGVDDNADRRETGA